MANTYSQIYLHFVFSVKGRNNLISEKQRSELQKYITGIVQNRGHKLLSIYCRPDHVHIFIGYNCSQPIPDLLRDVKASSAKYINENHWMPGKFEWQDGYGGFSHSRSQLNQVVQYINNQKEHHEVKSFKTEYLEMLEKSGIEFNEKYLFEWIDLDPVG